MLQYDPGDCCLHIKTDSHVTKLKQGANLPHLTKDGGVYSVTFRLADSLPRRVTDSWARERENIVDTAKQMGRALSESELARLEFLFRERVDKFLSSGHGQCWLARYEIAKLVGGAMTHFDHSRCNLLCWVVMPNHVHAILQPLPGYELTKILHGWKSYSAQMANRALKRSGEFWFPESYDHLIRDDEDLWHAVIYVSRNPVKAGLANWHWQGAKVDATGFGVVVREEARGQFEALERPC